MTTPSTAVARSGFGRHDLDLIDAMTATLPVALHHIDLPWRLASPAAQDPNRVRLWESTDGTLLAWAVLQFPWHCLDYEIRPGPNRDQLEREILGWAVECLGAEANVREASLPFYVSSRDDDPPRMVAIKRAGFRLDGWSYVHLTRELGEPIMDADCPDGFTIRPLAGNNEVDAYVAVHRAAFGSTNMTGDWRRRTLDDPRYQPDLDLVAVGPDGAIVAFCVGWITRPHPATGERAAQVEPIGVLPASQRIGLGRALLLEQFRRSRSMGATLIEIDAESYNQASRGLYEAVGFRPVHETPFALKVFGEPTT